MYCRKPYIGIAVDRNCDTFADVELTKRYFIPDILNVEAGTELQVIPLQRYILVPSGRSRK